jgi:hypothetical protein
MAKSATLPEVRLSEGLGSATDSMNEGQTMTDKELLEAAAKAVGHKIGEWKRSSNTHWLFADDGDHRLWNPLTDDGDALRLAVKCRIELRWNGADYVTAAGDGAWEEIMLGNDANEATRHAIVRAAAAMASK